MRTSGELTQTNTSDTNRTNIFIFFPQRTTEYLGLEGTSEDHPVQPGSPEAGGFGITLETAHSWKILPHAEVELLVF